MHNSRNDLLESVETSVHNHNGTVLFEQVVIHYHTVYMSCLPRHQLYSLISFAASGTRPADISVSYSPSHHHSPRSHRRLFPALSSSFLVLEVPCSGLRDLSHCHNPASVLSTTRISAQPFEGKGQSLHHTEHHQSCPVTNGDGF